MPDTVRTQAELLTLYADNGTGNISAQDGRDFIVSAVPASGTPFTPTSATDWTIVPTTIQEALDNLAMASPITVRKTITFDGSAGNGAIGTVAVFTHTGLVHMEDMSGLVLTSLTGVGAQLALGTPNALTAFIVNTGIAGMTTATPIWLSNNPVAESGAEPSGLKDVVVGGDIAIRIQTHSVDSGVLLVVARYVPLSTDGALVAA